MRQAPHSSLNGREKVVAKRSFLPDILPDLGFDVAASRRCYESSGPSDGFVEVVWKGSSVRAWSPSWAMISHQWISSF